MVNQLRTFWLSGESLLGKVYRIEQTRLSSPHTLGMIRTAPFWPRIHVLTDGVTESVAKNQWRTSLQAKPYLFREMFARKAQLPTDGARRAFFSFIVTQTRSTAPCKNSKKGNLLCTPIWF